MKKILVPCDFSTTSQQAYKFALDLALAHQGEVVVLKVTDIPIMYESTFGIQPYVFNPALLQDLQKEAEKQFEQMKDIYPSAIPVHFHVINGPLIKTIRKFITINEIDLVVMGTHGTSRWNEFLLGSNTEKMVRFSTVPVIAIKKAIDLTSIKSIVLPNTLELNQDHFIMEIKKLQHARKAILHLVYINTPVNFVRDSEIKKKMENFAHNYALDNYTLSIRSDMQEQDGIINFAHEIKADMIAMATHGHRGLTHVLIGSIAEDIVNHVDCPVWTCSLRSKKELLDASIMLAQH